MALTEAQARQALQNLLNEYRNLSEDTRKQMSEANVVRQFVDRLLEEVLGWPIKDPERYKYELVTQAGRPDLTLFPESGGTIFIEAKRFDIIKDFEGFRKGLEGTITPGQMALPGMATDRTQEEQQAINYAFRNGGTWAILTNFQKLRLFNARRDWLVLSFEEPFAYKEDFDLLWQLSYQNVLDGSLDILNNQRLRENVDTTYLSFINEWRERLARDVIEQPDDNPWVFHSDGSINLALLRATVQRFLDRLVVIRFAEDHLVIPPGTLRELYETRRNNPYTFSMDQFLDQFFRKFDKKHNSALFAKDITDEAVFSDEVLLPLIAKLYEARYRSMPADIIGNTYEQYLGKTLALDNGSITTKDNLETRKKQGSYYTPQVIVRYIVDNSLGRYLYGTENGQPDGKLIDGETRKTSADIKDLRVLDSACGSGSFLIYAYYVLQDFYESEIQRLEKEYEVCVKQMAAHFESITTDERIEAERLQIDRKRIEDYPRIILETHLYGVDLDPQAAEIAVVNLMMRAMERRHNDKRLPLILNQNVKVGNGLIGLRFDDQQMVEHTTLLAKISQLRCDLVITPNGTEHDQIIRDLEAATENLNTILNENFTDHFADLERIRPFHWGVEFPEVFYDGDGNSLGNPGFTIVIGNPPWEILKPDLREFYAQFDDLIESKLTRKKAEQRIVELDKEDPRRQDAYEAQKGIIEKSAAYFRAAPDYTHQGRGDTATHKLFTERMYSLLQNTGRLGYIVPSGIYKDLGTKELRQMLLGEGTIKYIYSFSNVKKFFPGVNDRVQFTLIGAQKGISGNGFWAAFRFNPRVSIAPDDLPDFLANEDNLVYIRNESLERFSPDSLSLMEFQTQQDYEIAEKIYGDWSLLGEEVTDCWNIKLTAEFHMTSDRGLFNTHGQGLRLYEGKMIHQFNAFFAEPQYWIEETKGRKRLENKTEIDYQYSRLVFRDIARSTDERTLISTILPPNVFCNNKTPVVKLSDGLTPKVLLYVCSILNSFALDFLIRQKVSATLNFFYMYTLPMPRLAAGNPYFDAIVPRAAKLTCVRSEFADLWKEVMGEEWDKSKGATDPDERQQLRNEIDAIVAHLYGLTRDEFDHILGTFALVFTDNDEGQAKRETLLNVYAEWADKFD
jgi:hypothetical protein